MRERLIQLLEEAEELPICQNYEGFADYLLDNGVVVLPCPIDTHIYVIPKKRNGLAEITKMVVRGFSVGKPYNVANCFRVRGTSALFQPSFEQFGKTVFLTREDAEKALKGGAE